ncbi:hypothetical protein [Martelella soudanensis]|uniref:hypothetical protein n=1 Tax=unclassified Martelella TaxID=2629616 RepID=UPI0015DFD855|nr:MULTISPECIES: hypothetical protein [unclassified Martelella]
MFEYLPLIAFQIAFAAAGLAILYRIVGGRLFATADAERKTAHDEVLRKAARTSHA